MFGIDLQQLLLDAIPLSFWVGLTVGGVVVFVVWAALWWLLGFLWRHRRVLLVLCAMASTGAFLLMVL